LARTPACARRSRLFLVRQSVAAVRWLCVARLSELAFWRDIHAQVFNLDLRYYDTNLYLSRENCFVLASDPNARPSGAINPVTNPDGLTSNWCSATFVAKVWFALN
jgi:hypothetical protein